VIHVVVKLSGPLREFYRTTPSAGGEEVELPAGATAADLLARCGIPPDKVHHLLVNRQRATLETSLADGDQVWAIPLAAGG
jgi:molybdopterin converting factor small subunit